MNAGYSSQIVADNFPSLKQTMMALQNIIPRVYDNFRPRISYPATQK